MCLAGSTSTATATGAFGVPTTNLVGYIPPDPPPQPLPPVTVTATAPQPFPWQWLLVGSLVLLAVNRRKGRR